jgi:hypothetical protein
VSLGDFSKLDFQFGPVEEVRFVQATPGNATLNIDPVRAGSVANLFTIQGNSAAPNCNIGQEPVSGQIDSAFNAIFRTPTPTFGLGLVENTPDLTLETSAAAFPNRKSALGIIPGVFNISGNDGSITRFGWKAQNKSLLIFAGEALNVEMGVTNELFPNERTNGDGGCPVVNAATTYPEDEVLATNPGTLSSSVATQIASTISSVAENDAVFMRLNSPPSQCDYQSGTTGTPPNTVAACKTLSANALIGQCLFGLIGATTAVNCPSVTGIPNLPSTGIGCVLCHQDTLTTANSSQNPGLNNVQYAPYSDFALHNMGTADADGVSQGGLPAGPQQFRTAPLWGVGQRIFLMHDGRYTDIGHAVKNHCPTATPTSPGADSTDEACGVIENYLQLGTMASGTALQTDLLEFLRSL